MAAIGVDNKTGLTHSAAASSVNVHDSEVRAELLRGEETRVYGDGAYRNQTRRYPLQGAAGEGFYVGAPTATTVR